MSLLVAWLILPLLLAVLALGCGLLIEAAGGVRLPGSLLAPAGLAVAVLAGQFATLSDATAELTVPLVVALAAAGLVLAPQGRVGEIQLWPLAAAVGVFAAFAAPVVLSGEATFAGYQRLNDTAIWLAITDHIAEDGRALGGLPDSSFKALLENYLGEGYPIGSFIPLAIGHTVLGQDTAWLFQPSVAFLAAMLALALYALAEPLVESRGVRALVASLASQPAILFGYSLWGGVKELAAAWILVTLAALLVVALGTRGRPASLVPAAVASAATLAILSAGGTIWIAVPLLGALALLVFLVEPPLALRRAGIFLALMLALAVPTLIETGSFISQGSEVLTSGQELGILTEPLSPARVLGVWPTADLRFDSTEPGVTAALLVVLGIGGLAGIAYACVRRAWGPLLYLSGAAIGCLVAAAFGSPWVDGKAYAIASPAAVLFALLGVWAVLRSPLPVSVSARARATVALAIAAAVVGGVLWSNVLAYRGVNLAPRDRFSELADVGDRIAGKGPTLAPDGEPLGEWHFLRDGATDRLAADFDRLKSSLVLRYRTLVTRRSPAASRPPAAYSLVWSGRFYDVWQRPAKPRRRTIEHLSLGSRFDPSAEPQCAEIRRLADRAGRGGLLVAVPRPAAIALLKPRRDAVPEAWKVLDDAGAGVRYLQPAAAGTLETTVRTRSAGRYGVWLGGAFRRRLEVLVDGKQVAARRHRLNQRDHFEGLGTVQLSRGAHRVALRYGGKDLHPGSDGPPFLFGPLVMSKTTAEAPLSRVAPRDAASLCGKSLDWVEALGR